MPQNLGEKVIVLEIKKCRQSVFRFWDKLFGKCQELIWDRKTCIFSVHFSPAGLVGINRSWIGGSSSHFPYTKVGGHGIPTRVYIMHANVLCMNPHITTPLMGETWCNSRDVSTRQECQRPFWTAHDGHGRRCDTVLTSDASKHHCRNCGRVVCDECSKDGEGWKVVAGHMMTPCWSTPLFTYTPTDFCTWMWLLWTKTDTHTQSIASGFEKEWFSIVFPVSMYTTKKIAET